MIVERYQVVGDVLPDEDHGQEVGETMTKLARWMGLTSALLFLRREHNDVTGSIGPLWRD